MRRDIRIAPSILAADITRLASELDRIKRADLIHIDVMDGHFTGNLTFGPEVVAACKRSTEVRLDVHMMVTNPDETVEWYVDAGADMVTVHLEAARHLHRVIARLRERNVLAGVVVNPATPIAALESIIDDVDSVLIMSVDPGFGGQAFIEGTYAKLRQLTCLCDAHQATPLIEVDGGISRANIAGVVDAGADVIVAGSAVFGAPDPAGEIERMRALGTAARARRKA